MSKERTIFRLQWSRDKQRWELRCEGGLVMWDNNKRVLEKRCRFHCRSLAAVAKPTQLLIYTRAGRIGRGNRSEASYNCDSRRARG